MSERTLPERVTAVEVSLTDHKTTYATDTKEIKEGIKSANDYMRNGMSAKINAVEADMKILSKAEGKRKRIEIGIAIGVGALVLGRAVLAALPFLTATTTVAAP